MRVNSFVIRGLNKNARSSSLLRPITVIADTEIGRRSIVVVWIAAGRKRCDKSYPLVRDEVEGISDDLVPVVHAN